VQYYYIFGSRAIYDNGWKAELAYPNDVLTKHVLSNPPLDENAWELYNLNDDPTERIDLAKQNPEKLTQLKAEYDEQAKAHHLAPYLTFDDFSSGRVHHTYVPQWYIDRQKEQAQTANSK
jgi:arylsulfatase